MYVKIYFFLTFLPDDFVSKCILILLLSPQELTVQSAQSALHPAHQANTVPSMG